MSKKESINVGERDSELEKPLSRTAAAVKQQFLISGFHQNTGAEAGHYRAGVAGAKQRDFQALSRRGCTAENCGDGN